MTHDPSEHSAQPERGGARWGRIPAWWLDHPDLDADGLAVLAALSTYADEAGVCWPSQTTLAAKLKRSRPTVNRIVARLEAIGLIAVEHRSAANGGRLSCRYRLSLTPPTLTHAQTAPDSSADSPCSAPSQEQLQTKQIPDSLSKRERVASPSALIDEVPSDWSPSADDRVWAATRFPDADLDRHAELFVRRCQAHGYRYKDFGAAWRSWLLQDIPAQTRVAPPPRKDSAAARQDAADNRLSAWTSVANRLNAAVPPSPWA